MVEESPEGQGCNNVDVDGGKAEAERNAVPFA